MHVNGLIIKLRNKRPIQNIAGTLGVAKRSNAQVSSTTPQGMEGHKRQLKWMIKEFCFFIEEKALHI